MRHYIQISARHKLLVINRAFLAHHGPPDARARAHKACVQNAQAILQELDRGQQPGTAHMQSLWTIPYHSVAAAVVLALDMIRPGDGRNTGSADMAGRRAEINRAFQALERLAPTSRIARRGLQVRVLHRSRRRSKVDASGPHRSGERDRRLVIQRGS